jgi:hypothetical protein
VRWTERRVGKSWYKVDLAPALRARRHRCWALRPAQLRGQALHARRHRCWALRQASARGVAPGTADRCGVLFHHPAHACVARPRWIVLALGRSRRSMDRLGKHPMSWTRCGRGHQRHRIRIRTEPPPRILRGRHRLHPHTDPRPLFADPARLEPIHEHPIPILRVGLVVRPLHPKAHRRLLRTPMAARFPHSTRTTAHETG